jgi:hypothetical protein
MSYELGAVKWFVGMLLAPVGYVSLHIFGDGLWNTVTHFQAIMTAVYSDSPTALLNGLIRVYIPMPGEILDSLVLYPVVGGTVGALYWYLRSGP